MSRKKHPEFIAFHDLQPDYSRPLLEIPSDVAVKIKKRLELLYGPECGDNCYHELVRLLRVYFAHKTDKMKAWESTFIAAERFTQDDVILITYGDLIQGFGERPLVTLTELCEKYLKGVFNTLHILPFFPYSSDRGFAVMDFEEVDPNLGTWDDILHLKKNFRLMFDGVFNHVSSKSRWFQEFLNQNPDYENFFTVFSTREQVSIDHLQLIVRPRTSDILSEFPTLNGPRLVWTNFKNPKVFLKMLEIMLYYVRRGADLLRLDAITYLWEELGTTCVHLQETHVTVKLFRDVLNLVAPHVALITETNVPHEDNIRYFGDGQDEAQMVYNFALPPLVLHAFQTGNAHFLTRWAAELRPVSDQATYFNFLDSHDGIGVMAVRDILPQSEIEMMALRVLEHGGFISYKDNGDGSESPYELNITWFSAINRYDSTETFEMQIKRYLASRAIAMVIMGVPGVYLHGLLGSENDAASVLIDHQTRSINRKTLTKEEVVRDLHNPETRLYRIALGLGLMIRKRTRQRAFHPNARQSVLNLHESVFAVVRQSVDGQQIIIALTNVTPNRVPARFDPASFRPDVKILHDLLHEQNHPLQSGKFDHIMQPYEVLWLELR